MGQITTQHGPYLGFRAEQDLTNQEGKFVELNTTTGQVDICDTLGETVIGVLITGAGSNQPVSIQDQGIARVLAGGTITRGLLITTDGSGTGINANSSDIKSVGISTTAAASGGYFEMLIRHYHVNSAI